MSRRAVSLIIRVFLIAVAGLAFTALGSMTKLLGGAPAYAAGNICVETTGGSGPIDTITLTGASVKLTLDGSGKLAVNGTTCQAASAVSSTTTIAFSSNTASSQTVEFDQTGGAWPCILAITGSLQTGSSTNGIVQIDAADGENVTVGSDGISLSSTCAPEQGTSPLGGVGQYVLVGRGQNYLSAQGASNTNPTSIPVTFEVGNSVTNTSDFEYLQAGSGPATLSFANMSAPGTLTVNASSTTFNGLPSGLAQLTGAPYTYTYYFVSGQAQFTNFVGRPSLPTTFAAGSVGGLTFSDPATNGSTVDFSSAPAINANLGSGTSGTVTVSGQTDTLTNIFNVVGSNQGSNVFTAGANGPYTFTASGNNNTFNGGSGTDTFSASGNNNTFKVGTGAATISAPGSTGNTIDFSALNSAVTVNVSGNTVGTVVTNTAQGTHTYNFSGLAQPLTFKGSQGGTTFYAGDTLNYTFIGSSSSDVVDFSNASNPITANLSVSPATVTIPATPGNSDTVSGISKIVGSAKDGNIFIGGSAPVTFAIPDTSSLSLPEPNNNTFRAGTGNETFTIVGTSTGNTLDFSSLSVPLSVNVTGSGTGKDTATTASATYNFASFGSTPVTILGSTGGTTFLAGSNPGYTFQGEGGTTVADFSASGPVLVDMHANPVTVTLPGSGSPTDILKSISSVIGSNQGGNTFIAGSTSETFGDSGPGTNHGETPDIIDFTFVGTSQSAPLTINVSGAPVSTSSSGQVLPNTAVVGSTVYSFVNSGTAGGGADFQTFVGSGFGNTAFLAGNSGGYEFCSNASSDTLGGGLVCNSQVIASDTLDFSAVATRSGQVLVINMQNVTPGTGVAVLPNSAGTDTIIGFDAVTGANSGFTTFESGGAAPFIYTFTGPGSNNIFEAGTGSANFVSSGTGNTIDFSESFGPASSVTINVSGVQVGSVATGTATAGGSTYTFTSFASTPIIFDGGRSGSIFIAGSTGDTFNGVFGTSNTLTFANAPGSSLTICTQIDPNWGGACKALSGPAAILGSVQEPFSNITTFTGLAGGNTTFEAGDAIGGLTFNATGTGNSADFSAAGSAVKVDLSQNPIVVTLSGVPADNLSGVTSVTGSHAGGNLFIAGNTSETFSDVGPSGNPADTIDFSKVGTSSSTPLTINVSGGPVSVTGGTVANYTALVGSTVYTFSNVGSPGGGADFRNLLGASGGNTEFLAGDAAGYLFCAVAVNSVCTTTTSGTDALDLTSATHGVIVDLSGFPTSGTVTTPGGTDTVKGILSYTGSLAGSNTFQGGPSGSTYSFNGPGSGNDFRAGSGSATFVSNGSNNTVDFSQLGGGATVTVNVSGVQVGSVLNGTAAASSGQTYTFTSFASSPNTYIGAPGGTTFLAGAAANTFEGGAGTDSLSFANAPGSSLSITLGTNHSCPAFGSAALGSVTENFCGIESFTGLAGGNTTFADPGHGGYTFNGSGTNNVADFSGATSGILADLSQNPAKISFTPSIFDVLTNVSTIVGSSHGGNTFVAGTSSETFSAGGTNNAIDFSAVPTASGSPLTVNVSGTPVNGISNFTAAAGSVTYTFTNGGSGFLTFVGASSGNTKFLAPRSTSGGYTFCADATTSTSGVLCTANTNPGDTVDFTANITGIVVTMTPGVNSGVIGLGSGTDGIDGITTIIGSPVGSNTFYGGLDGNIFTSTSSNNTLSYVQITTGQRIDLINSTVGGIDSFSFPSGTLTVQGTQGSDTFVIGSRAVTLEGGGCTVSCPVNAGMDTLDLSGITPSGGTGVDVNLVAGQLSGPSIGGVNFGVAPSSGDTCASSTYAAFLCVSKVIGTSGNDVFTVSSDTPALTLDGNGGTQDSLDLSQIASGSATVHMPIGTSNGTVALTGVSITFKRIPNLTGTQTGGDYIYVGTGTESFTEISSSNMGTLDYSALTPAGTAGITVTVNDISGGFSGTTTSPVTIGVNDTFTNIGSFVGTPGNDSFAQNGPSPNPSSGFGYTFNGAGGNNTLDLTGTGSDLTITLTSSGGCSAGTNSGTATGTGVNDSFDCMGSVVASSTLYRINPGQTGTVNGSGNGVLELVGDVTGNGATINLVTGQVTGDGYNFTFKGMTSITGTPYNDLFIAGPGSYTLNGGGGIDGVDFTNAPAAVQVNLSSGPYTIPTGMPNAGNTIAGGTATGGYGGTLTLAGISNVIGTSRFNDLFVAGPGYGYFVGGAGADRFVLTGGNDIIYGGTGGSTLDLTQLTSVAQVNLALSSAQYLGTGNGTLQLVPGTITTVIAPNAGSNIYGGSGTVTLVGGSGNDILSAGIGTQTLIGGGGADTLVGGIGSDTMVGGTNAVTFIPGQGTDTLQSTANGNTLSYDGVPNAVYVNLSNQNYTVPNGEPYAGTSLGAGTASGGNGATVNLSQASITNVVGSYAGDVFVTGPAGNHITGNGGNDLFVVDSGNNVLTAAPGSGSRFLFVASGSNQINGGGASTVDFSQSTNGVTVNLQSGQATGGFGGFQALTGILNIVGARASGDTLIGGSPGGLIIGLGVNDLLEAGASGGDTLVNNGSGGDTFCAMASCQVGGTVAGGGDTLIATGAGSTNYFFTQNGVVDTIQEASGALNSLVTDPNDKIQIV